MKGNKILLGWSSVLVGLQILTGGAALADYLGTEAAGLAILIVAALQGATQFFINGVLTPSASVAAYVNANGDTLAGPAAPMPDGKPVTVHPAA